MRAGAVLVATGLAVLTGLAAGSGTAARPGGVTTMRALQGVNFVGSCRFSHMLMDDPIVFPKQPGASHHHTFVGNTTTNAFSTLRSLLAAASTCRRAGETAAYWMPTLLLNGQSVEPRGATIYYRRRTLAPVRPFPAGFKMIAGSSLDSADHQSHMAYSLRGRCPATHPVAVPAVSLIFRYPIAGGAGVSLASGGQYSAHGDFFNAWNQPTLASLVDGCLNALRHCGQQSS